MKFKKFTSLAFGLGMAFSSVIAQNCSVLSESINQNFSNLAHGTRPPCWVAHTPNIPNYTFNGVSINQSNYHIQFNSAGYPPNNAQVQTFIVAMQRCTMRGPLSFQLTWAGALGVARPFQVGTMSDPNNPATFVPVETFSLTDFFTHNLTVDFTSYVGTNNYIAFRTYLSNNNGYIIDNIVWSGPPAVVTPVMPPKGF